ncbi:hypothetical protein O6H91_19G007100 [Diphasiastrum complanatum]|uniref:Uncharacterized protein n=1 Tax=Diphasiastrum complanatum TaxID=34168 RepID=A0ACC2ASF4_DIPCM|nr:hypothetical protein O6H91_19G007100 [Diphasiastrum complanatum]
MAVLAETYPCVPVTERGRGILIAGDAKTNSIVYCNGRSVIIRSLEDPLLVDIYSEHAYAATVARFSPNGEWIASGDVSGSLRIWARGPGHILKLEIRALSGRIDDLQWSADGERIVVSGDGKGKTMVRAFMWDTGANIGEFDGHSKRVLSCAFKPNRPFRIATCGEDYLVNFYEGPPFRFSTSHREHTNFVNCVRFSSDGSKFITVGSDKKGVIFSGKTGEKIGQLSTENGHTGSIYSASWSFNSKQVLTVSADKTAIVWDVSDDGSGSVNRTFSFSDSGAIEDMQVGCLWLNNYMISISLGGVINFLTDSTVNSPGMVLSGHIKSITSITVAGSGLGSIIYSSSYDGVIIKWKLGTGYVGRLEQEDQSSIYFMAAVEGHLLTCGLDDKLHKSVLHGDQLEEAGFIDLRGRPRDFSVASSATDIALVCTDDGIVLFHGLTILSRLSFDYKATAVAISPAGTKAVVGAQNGKLYIYEIKGDSFIQETVLEKHRGPISVVCFSPDSSMIASGDENREAVVWDDASKEVELKNMLYHTARITCLAWSPDSSKVATGSVDSCIYIYTIGKPASHRTTIKGAHIGGVSALSFADSVTLASGGDDACVRIWTLS